MLIKIIAICLLVMGAAISLGAKKWLGRRGDFNESQLIVLKLTGLVITGAGTITALVA